MIARPTDPSAAVAQRYALVRERDGETAAQVYLRENIVAAYRRVVVDGKTHTMYRRRLIESYLAAKRLLASVAQPTEER